MEAISEIKSLLGAPSLVIGAEKTLKALRAGKLQKAFLATNPKPELKADIERLAQLSSVELVQLEVPNDELGTLCKKPFPISVIGIVKE